MNEILDYQQPRRATVREKLDSAYGWFSFPCVIYLGFLMISSGPRSSFGGSMDIIELAVVAGVATGFAIHAIRFGRGSGRGIAIISACILLLFYWLVVTYLWREWDWIWDYYRIQHLRATRFR